MHFVSGFALLVPRIRVDVSVFLPAPFISEQVETGVDVIKQVGKLEAQLR